MTTKFTFENILSASLCIWTNFYTEVINYKNVMDKS